jgi:membrane carboxypeptidase/penicillin-binding protein
LQGALTIDLAVDELAACPALDFLSTAARGRRRVDHNVSNAALVAIDPRTGEIKAMMGSLDYWNASIDGSFNVAADGLRQPGRLSNPSPI